MRTFLLLMNAIVAIIAAQDTSATLSGEVRDITGATFQGVYAELKREEPPHTLFSVRTNHDGVFKFTALPAGAYALTLEAPAFRKLTLNSIQVASGEERVLPPLRLDLGYPCGVSPPAMKNLRLLSGGGGIGNLGGSVIRTEAHPISHATVKLLCEERKVCGETETDLKGEYIFFNLPPRDKVIISVTRPGFYPWEGTDYAVRAGLDSTYWPIILEHCPGGNCDPRLRPKKPLPICE